MLSARVSRPKATILVVDDSLEMQRYLRFLLELDSYQVEIASDGTEALHLLREGFVPSIVLLDVQMPGMDGLKTLRRLLKLQPDLKVIMCSGVDDPSKMQQAALLGAQGYLTKPVQHLYLTAVLDRCLGATPVQNADKNLGPSLVPSPPLAR
jgi:CheY-like chemotaxis protein